MPAVQAARDFEENAMMTFPTAAIVMAAAMVAPTLPQPMAMDTPVSFNGVDTVCTGVGSAKDDPQWAAYPIRIEFSNGGAQYLSGAHVTLTDGGKTVADVNCAGPWVLVRGTPGAYRVTASMNGSAAKPATAAFTLGNGAQKRVVLRFPDFQVNE
ncbi:MAG TPA: hypothetical protein VNU97_06285 [Rhizomicrobium sp.]|jgi:hypothetical protein|nr:hypothetical protein [Rhizomicrobium sp.]